MILHQLECLLPSDLADPLSSLLEEDVLSASWDEKTAETCHFQIICKPAQAESIEKRLEQLCLEQGLAVPQIKSYPLPEKNWVAAVHQGFPPLTIAKFYIYGSHITTPPPPSLIPLKIEAATAFGSGQHESTEGCLQALSLLADELTILSPLDMGCGSGILALAMASLWHVSVLACDNDPEAVRVTLENASINNLKHLITAQVSEGFDNLKTETFDLITANILAKPLCQMAGDVERSLIPGGYIILAGLLNRQAEEVVDAYRSRGMKLINQLFIGDWSTLVMRKQDNG